MTMHDTAALREGTALCPPLRAGPGGQPRRAGMRWWRESLRRGLPPLPARLALYSSITLLSDPPERRTDEPLSPRERCALLLTSLEGLTIPEAAQVLAIEDGEAETTVSEAREKVKQTVSTEVLIIEDEPVIALDIRLLVSRCGHKVVGVAASEAEAIRLAPGGPAGPDPRRCQPRPRWRRHHRGAPHPRKRGHPRHLRDCLSRAAADGGGRRAGLHHQQAVRPDDACHRHLPGDFRRSHPDRLTDCWHCHAGETRWPAPALNCWHWFMRGVV